MLILDEPTNHLDIDSREALVHALNDYDGAVIVISHDRHFVNAIADRLWVVRNGSVAPYTGDMQSYRSEILAERDTRKDIRGDRNGDAKSSRADERRLAASRRSELAPLKKIMQDAETRVGKLSTELAKYDTALGRTDLYDDAEKAQKVVAERAVVAKKLAEAEDIWLQATEQYETAASDA